MPQKRTADSADPHASKKTRFVEPSDDPVNFAEQVDAALEDPSARKKGRVKNEGYESDSSDDGEGVVLSRRKDEAAENDDDDMFAMGDEAKKKEEEPNGKKEQKYLRLGEIEGQEFGGDRSGSESESEEEPEDEDDEERRKKRGMGYELSSFNMREEMEEGKFTEDGSYVRTFDQHQVHDKWMEGLSEKDIKQARRRKRQREKEQQEKILAEERELEQSGGKGALELQLLPFLKKGETVLEALQRIGKRKHSSTKTNGKSASMDVDKKHHETSDIDQITHLASNIMSLGDTDVYSRTYEELVRDVRSSGKVDDSWVPPSADVKYEYIWDTPGATAQPGETFGPFSEEEMLSWFKASYFGEMGEKIKVRAVGKDWATWDETFV